MANYFLNATLVTITCYLFYRLVLHRFTFHNLNRLYLLFAIIFSLTCPILEINFSLEKPSEVNNIWIEEIYEISTIKPETIINNHLPNHLPLSHILLFIYLAGGIIFLFKLIHNLFHIVKLKLRSRRVEIKGQFFYINSKNEVPFSFFNWIFLPPDYQTQKGIDSIVEHELIHSRQFHSLDLLITEIFCVIFWFNPFSFFLKKSIKTTHEFIADHTVIQKKSFSDYLKLLVSSAEIKCFSGIVNHFQSITLKKRINMILKNKTSNYSKLSYLLIIPVVLVSIMGFGNLNINMPEIAQIQPLITEIKPNIKPIKENDINRISSRWGNQKHPITKKTMMHEAIDIAAKTGTPVLSTAYGKIVKVESDKNYGKFVMIQHSETYSTLYSHLSEFKVNVGDIVNQGDVIGNVGNTGISTGPHLHYEVWKNGERVNPEEYFE